MWIDEDCSRQNCVSGRMTPWVFVVIIVGALLAGCSAADTSFDSDHTESGPRASEPTAVDPREPVTVDPSEPATPADLFPEGPGRSLVLDNCGSCHAVACSAIGQRTPARWDNLKDGHREHVSNLNEQDLETVFAYLKEHFNDTKPEPKVPPHFLEGGCTPL